MQQAAVQIDALIQDLLDVTRLEAGRLTVSPRDVDPVPLVEAALYAMRALAESSGVALEATYEEALPMVYADPDRVTQLLSNLRRERAQVHAGGWTCGRAREAVRPMARW